LHEINSGNGGIFCMEYKNAYIWCEEELYSIYRAFESQSPDEKDGKDQIWQSGSDVHSLRNEIMA